MKRIFFDKIDSWKNGIIIIPAVILLLIASLGFFTELINDPEILHRELPIF